jgi:hypothetical protein
MASGIDNASNLLAIFQGQSTREFALDIDLVLHRHERDLRADGSSEFAERGVKPERFVAMMKMDTPSSIALHGIEELTASGPHYAEWHEKVALFLERGDLAGQESPDFEDGLNTMARLLPRIIVIKDPTIFEEPKYSASNFGIGRFRGPLRSEWSNRETVQAIGDFFPRHGRSVIHGAPDLYGEQAPAAPGPMIEMQGSLTCSVEAELSSVPVPQRDPS